MKLPYNKNLLLTDILFPLTWDVDEYKSYILDAEHNMIAQTHFKVLDAVEEYHPFEKLIGDYKETFNINNDRYHLNKLDIYDMMGTSEAIGCIRGWGRLQAFKSPDGKKRQDNIAKYILAVINS